MPSVLQDKSARGAAERRLSGGNHAMTRATFVLYALTICACAGDAPTEWLGTIDTLASC